MSIFRTKFNGVELDVEYIYTPGTFRDYDTPAEPAYVDLLAIMTDGSEIDILDVVNPAILEAIREEIHEYYN